MIKNTGSFLGIGEISNPTRKLTRLVAVFAALCVSARLAGAVQVNVLLTGVDDTASNPDANYWNVFEFEDKDGSFESVTDAPDTNDVPTTISVSGYAQEYNGEASDNAGGDLTFEIDLPCGTFDVAPGYGIGSSTSDITGGNFTGIVGPTNVYLTFHNNGYPITTATSIIITGDIYVPPVTQVNILLTGVDDTASNPDANYWNVFEFEDKDGSFESVTDAPDTNDVPTGISVSGYAQEYNGEASDNAGGTLTFEIDLPCGTFDISPGFGRGSSSADITGGCFTGITGPTTVYLDFLNNGYPITTATSIVISQY